jgi:hypothetical protein
MVLACEPDLHGSFLSGSIELDFAQSGIPQGAQLLDFLGPLGITGACLI